MSINKETDDKMQKLEEHVIKLREPTRKTLALIITSFKKSRKRLKLQTDILKDEEKTVLQNKLKRISRELKVLKTLAEDDIIVFALTTPNNLMAVAANKRLRIIDRLKARVASHKPLSSHLVRVRSKLNNTEKSESDEQEGSSETEGPLNNLDKIALNNQIVKMRKYIRQAKVHIIHKLTRNVAKLHNKKGSDKMKEKFERKAARLIEKIKCIKELFIDDVSKFALTSNMDMNKLSVDTKSSVRTQSMASIAAHKFVAVQVDSFKRTFPDWEKTAAKILMKKKKKRKLNKESKGSVKNSEVAGPNSGESSESEQMDSENEIDKIDNNEDSEEGSDIEDEIEDGKTSDKEDEENQSDSNSERGHWVSKLSDVDLCGSANESDDYTISEVSKITNVIRKTKLKSKLNCNSVNKVFSDSPFESPNNIIKQKKKVKTSSKIQKPKDIPKIVDPFFITSANEEYVTSQVPVEVKEDPNNQVNNQRIESHTSKFSKFDSQGGLKSNKFDFQAGLHNKPFRSINRFEKMPYPNKGGQRLGVGNRKERRQALHQPAPEEKIEKLHPSWEAKKKLPLIASFHLVHSTPR